MNRDSTSTLLARCDLYVDVESRALICRKCKYALATASSQVTTHLDRKHGVSKELRKGLTQYLRQHPCAFKDPSSVPLRPHGSTPHPELNVHEGFACRQCEFYTISLKQLTSHLSKLHLRERASKPRTDGLYYDVFLQTWGDGPTRKYWTVSMNGSTLRQLSLPCADEHLKLVREREQARREEQQRTALTDMGTQTLQNTGPWMERTRWPITYQGVRRDVMLGLAELPVVHDGVDLTIGQSEHDSNITSPAGDEQKIWHLTQAVQTVLDRCEETMRRTGRPLLCWLITTRPSPCFPKPFKFLAREQTRRYYRRWLKCFLAFVFRAWRMESSKRSMLPGLQFSRKQLTRLRSIWDHRLWDHRVGLDLWSDLAGDQQRRSSDRRATDDSQRGREAEGKTDDEEADEEATDEQDETDLDEEQDVELDAADISGEDEDALQSDSSTDSSLRKPVLSDKSSEIHAAAAELLELLFELCITFMTEEFKDGQPSSSTLVFYSGVLALQGTGETFRTAKSFTPILSQLIYVQRLLFLEYALPYRAYPHIGLEQRPRYGQLERLNAVRLKYMVEGAMHPLAEFQSLRDFGRVIGRTDAPSFLFRWSDDGQTISHGTKQVTMDSFRHFSKVFVDEAEDLCRELMFGVLPPVDLSQVKDEIGNTSQGFSFVHHPNNHLSEAYLELSTRACTTRRNGLLREGRWNWKAIFLYLKKVEAFQEAVAGMCYTSGGQFPRVSELFGLECENGPTSARGFYMYNGRVFYLTRHHKAKRSTNREFYVARYLPARASRVVYYHLVYIWPFVRMLRRERQDDPSKHGSTLLFCSDQTPDRPWESRKLTAVLQRASLQVWGWLVNAQLCRQLAIAITEKHVKEVHQRFNRYDDKSPNADINIAYAWQSGHRPLQRANTYGLDGAFPTHLQPSLLRIYEWVSIRWHEFLQQPTKGFSSDVSTGEHELQQQSSPATLQPSPAQASFADGITPTFLPTDPETSSTKKRKRCTGNNTGNNATKPLEATYSNDGKRQKYRSTGRTHSLKVIPHSPAIRPSDEDSSPANDDLPATSFVQSPTHSLQRNHSSTAAFPPERQKSVRGLLDAQAKRKGTACDDRQQRLIPQAKEPRTGNCGQPSDAISLSISDRAASRDGERGLLYLLSESARMREERVSAPIDLKTLKSQIRIWSERCSLCHIRGYWCSGHHMIAQCRVPGADQVRQTRSDLQRNMMSFRDSGGSFCSGQCEMSINLFLPASDSSLMPECACESAVLDGLSAMMGDPSRNRLNDITELKKRAPGGQAKDLHTWLCSTEEVGGGESATATMVFGQLSRVARHTGTPEPIDRSVNTKLVRNHLAQRDKADKELWAEGKHPQILHRLRGQLEFWSGVPCSLCLTYEWRESVYDHELRDCRLREESASTRKMLRFLCTVEQPKWRGSGQCASCRYPQQICRGACDDGSEIDEDCSCIIAIKKGIAVLLTVHNGVLREIISPQLVIAETHRERVDTRAWLEQEVEFWGIRVNKLLTIFHNLADGYDGLTGKNNVRAVPEPYVP